MSLHAVERGTGRPAVFVHGALADFREWEPVAEALSNGFRTITYSRRYNHPNENAFAGSDHSAWVKAEDLARLLAEREAAPAHVVGVSDGALAALLLAIEHPELVRTLTLVEPPILGWLPDLSRSRSSRFPSRQTGTAMAVSVDPR